MSTYWICRGDVRGDCNVKHRSHEAAHKHCDTDDRAVKEGHGRDAYSDRTPVEVERRGGPGRPEVGDMVHLRIPADLLADVDGIAEQRDATRSETIRDLLAGAIER